MPRDLATLPTGTKLDGKGGVTRVLVVDDDRSIRRSLEKFLGGLGLDVHRRWTEGAGEVGVGAPGGATRQHPGPLIPERFPAQEAAYLSH